MKRDYKKEYRKGKENAINKAIIFFDEQLSISWHELSEKTITMEKLAKKYGLVREFKENGII